MAHPIMCMHISVLRIWSSPIPPFLDPGDRFLLPGTAFGCRRRFVVFCLPVRWQRRRRQPRAPAERRAAPAAGPLAGAQHPAGPVPCEAGADGGARRPEGGDGGQGLRPGGPAPADPRPGHRVAREGRQKARQGRRHQDQEVGRCRGLVLSPTRELAIQTMRFCRAMGKYTSLRAALLVGGESMEDQFAALADGPDIIIATPGE